MNNSKTGIYIPLITPFNKDGSVDYRGLANATEFVLNKGADGIYAIGSSSEFVLLTTEEKKKCLKTIIENANGKEVIAQVGSTSLHESLDLAKYVEEVGANIISSVAPFYFSYTFEETKQFFYTLAEATSLPLMIYNNSQGRSYTLTELEELMKHPKITAMKFTNTNFYQLERLKYKFNEKRFYSGADECFLSGQITGVDGAIGTNYNYNCEKMVECRKLFLEGKNSQALKLLNKVNNVIEALTECENFIAGCKYLMSIQGLEILPTTRKPFGELSQKSMEILKKVYNENIAE